MGSILTGYLHTSSLVLQLSLVINYKYILRVLSVGIMVDKFDKQLLLMSSILTVYPILPALCHKET